MVLMRSMRTAIVAAFISALLLFGTAAVAHDAHDPRHQVMESLGEHMKALRGAAESAAALGASASSHARAVKEGAQKLLSLFPESSRGRKGSREKPEIWSDWPGFAAAAAAFEKAADGVVAAVSSGDKARLATALKAAGRECAGCHDHYRAPEK
jgi:cytochrome c556